MIERGSDPDEKRLRLLAESVARGDPAASAFAARELTRIGAAAVPTLRALLDPKASAPLGRFLAIGALEQLAESSPAAHRAIEAARFDPEPLVCTRAMAALAALGDGEPPDRS